MELDLTPKTLINIRVFGVEAFGNHVKWRLDRPVAVCVTANDEIMIGDAHNCVHVFDQRGNWRRTFGTAGDFAGKIQNIVQICASKSGDFVVVAMMGRQFKFQLYDSNGNFRFEFGMRDAKSCHGIAIDKEGRILSVDGNGIVVQFNTHGNKISEINCYRVKFPAGIGVNDNELIFLGDRENHCVQVYTYQGLFRYYIGGCALTPCLLNFAISGHEDILIAEIRNGKFCVTLFKQDGTWKSYSEAPEYFPLGAAFALLSNDNLVITTKHNRAFIYEQTNKPRAPVPLGFIHHCNVPARYRLQHLLSDNFQASRQPRLLHDNLPVASQHLYLGPGGSLAQYQPLLLHQNIQAPSQLLHHGLGGFLTPSQLQHIPSSTVQVLSSEPYLPSGQQAPQNSQSVGSYAPSPTQNLQPQHLQPQHLQLPHLQPQNLQPQYLQPNVGGVVQSHIPASLPNIFDPDFNDQRSRELGLHRPIKFSNNNELQAHQRQAIAGGPQPYQLTPPTLFAVPLRPSTAPLPFGGVNNNEQYSPRRLLRSEAQLAHNRLVLEQHNNQQQQMQLEQVKRMLTSQFDRETAAISEDLQALSLPNDGRFATPTPRKTLLLLDLERGPLAKRLRAPVDLNASMDFKDHPLYPSEPRRCDTPFEADKVQDSTCPLPLRCNKIFAAPAIPQGPPRRQHINHCGYIRDFQKPCAVAVDSQDNVIVVDAADNRVLVYNKHGKRLFSFGESGSGAGQLVKPRKVAADPQTRAIVILEDTSISQIKIFCHEGKFRNSFLSNYIERPRAMTVSKKSEIAVVQFSDLNVVMHGLSGELIRIVKCNGFTSPTGIAVGDFEFFISDSTDDCVKVYNFDGQLIHRVGNALETPSPIGVAIASNGDVAVVDTKHDFRLTCYNTIGSFTAGYYSEKRHRNFEGFALTSNDDVLLICDDGKLWYYDTRRSSLVTDFCPEKWLTSSPEK